VRLNENKELNLKVPAPEVKENPKKDNAGKGAPVKD
jgi:hypothetical protein